MDSAADTWDGPASPNSILTVLTIGFAAKGRSWYNLSWYARRQIDRTRKSGNFPTFLHIEGFSNSRTDGYSDYQKQFLIKERSR